MPRSSDALSRMEVLVLSTLARRPMHGYELKMELRYKHVAWWAKCEHGHIYATLERLARNHHIRRVHGEQGRNTYAATPAGLERVRAFVRGIATAADQTYFDVDLFLSAAFLLRQRDAVALLAERATEIEVQLAAARTIQGEMGENVPTVARLIMEHRVEHLEREATFARTCSKALERDKRWGPFLGRENIRTFIERTGTPLEEDAVRGKRGSRRKVRR